MAPRLIDQEALAKWVENKQVTCHAVPEEIPKCLEFLLSKYMAMLPKYAFEQDILYLHPEAKLHLMTAHLGTRKLL